MKSDSKTTAARFAWALGAAAGAIVAATRANFHSSPRSCKSLHDLIDHLPQCATIHDRLTAIQRAFIRTFGFPWALLLSEHGRVTTEYRSPGFSLTAADRDDAAACMSRCTIVSRPDRRASEHHYSVPLVSVHGCMGALALRTNPKSFHESWPLLRSFANQISLTIVRSNFEHQARYAKVLSEAGQFQKTLLDSIAHNVRTPLASIIGSLSALQEDHAMLNGAIRGELLDTAREEADRLNRLLGNLLDFSRLESGSVRVRADPCDVQDVIGAALEQLGSAARNRPLDVMIAPDLPLVHMDFVLIVQVIVNLLDNALKYSPKDRPILMTAGAVGRALAICVADEGDGISDQDIAHVFEKFNRAGRSGETGGMGLGLSICRGLVEAHHGTISIERRQPRGTAVTFTVPLPSMDQDGT